mmetsp:Transcript_27413/g.60250  ORF Transcript_27413/g.60250 Transcript_27413/m.60250 type:complete len:239 (-) Transcript_27413:61-777(-)
MLGCLPGFGGKRGGQPHQLVLLGLEGAGKTTLVYHLKIPNWKEICKDMKVLAQRKEKADPGYHYEELFTNPLGSYGVWDVPGTDVMVSLWPTFYRYVQVAGLIFVVDGNEEPYEAAKKDPTGSEMKKYDDKLHKARRLITNLVNEDELRAATFTVIINHRDNWEEVKEDDKKKKLKKDQRERFDHIRQILQLEKIQNEGANKGRFHIHEFDCATIKPNGQEWTKVVKEIHDMTLLNQA